MRLLDARTLQFKEAQGPRSMPKYAILSHTWSDNEVVYSDLVFSLDLARQRPEFSKVAFAAQQALDDGLDYIWIDSCNIDKSSSAELSETINSMYMLYKKAETCYAYLVDIAEPPPAEWKDNGYNDNAWTEAFANAKWFSRGWTLQELLAPRNVVFYSSNWTRIGTKRELCQTISRNTGISSTTLLRADFGRIRIAERMSWAAKRETTRVEDQAYCLLGIFDINMPLLYGEGERAFLRLQHEIIKKTNDRSIFLWQALERSHTTFRNLFASSPAEFRAFDDYQIESIYGRFELTQSGLEIAMSLIEIPNAPYPEFFAAVVDDGRVLHCIRLREIEEGEFLRVDADRCFFFRSPDLVGTCIMRDRRPTRLITIPSTLDNCYPETAMDYRLGGFYVEQYPIELQIINVKPSHAWDLETHTLQVDCSTDLNPFEDEDAGGFVVEFAEILHPEIAFEVDLRDQLRLGIGFKPHKSSNEAYDYVSMMKQRFIGDKKINILQIKYQIHEEGGMRISSEKNPLPGRYISYKEYVKEDHEILFGVPADNDEDQNSEGAPTPCGVEEEISEPEGREFSPKNGNTAHSDDADGCPPSAQIQPPRNLAVIRAVAALRQLQDLGRIEDLSRMG